MIQALTLVSIWYNCQKLHENVNENVMMFSMTAEIIEAGIVQT